MANKVLTVFQNLDKAISGNWGSDSKAHSNSYDMIGKQDKVIYKTDNKADYIRTKTELQQNSYLNQRWKKANVDLTVQAFTGLNNIKLMYRDAELMDAFPEIGAALDTVAEESALAGSDGRVVNVYSKSERIKNILEDLFTNRLNLEIMASMVIRAMCKYGNQFMLLNIDNKKGVMGWRQLPVYNVERLENGIENPYSAQGFINGNPSDSADLSTKFLWIDANNSSQVEFRNWQIGHFRLITNSLYLPYGCIVGDTRIETELGYKEIKDISIGDKVWTFNVDTQERELSEVTMHMNKGTKDVYKLKTKYNSIEATNDHKFLCYENDNLIYKELKDINLGDYLVVNTDKKTECDDIKIDKSELKDYEKNQKSLSWWFDYLNNIPDYVDEDFARFLGFMFGDGWLSHGYHVMFALGEYDVLNFKYIKLLEKFSGKSASFVPQKKGTKRKLPYHTAFVGSKMLYTILKRMGFVGDCYTKRIPLWVYNSSNKIREAFLDGLIDADGSMHVVSPKSISYTIELANEQLVKDIKVLVQSLGYRSGNIGSRNRVGRTSIIEGDKPIVTVSASYYLSFYKDDIKNSKQVPTLSSNTKIQLQKVIFKEYSRKCETYDITVKNNNSNFFANGIVTHNCSYLHTARRHWRLLSLMEDMMFIYRLERSMERRVYKIYVGAIDDADVQAYVEEIANNFKRTPIIDPETGQIDLRKNIMPVRRDTPIPLLDGRTITIEELAKEYEEGKTNYVYSVQDKTKQIVPGKVVWCGKNYTADELVKVTLDDDTYVVLAKEHEFIMRDGSKKRADEVQVGDSIMPYYVNNVENPSNLSPRNVISVEIIGGDDVYCMTVVGLNGEEDRHNFALRSFNEDGSWCENGCFVSNCVDQDIFIPTRSESAPNPIDTLSAGQNLTAIDDIKYIQNKVLTALRIPKSFLNFEDAAGDGKNLALMDIRFTRTVNRIQQAFLMELTKIASIHLYLLGFEDELTNFSLTMNNPSTQAEQLEIENIEKKISAIRDAVADPGNGIPIMSLTRALKEIMKWSDKEIQDNFEELRLEKALSSELEKTTQIIKKTGIFDTVDRIYGEPGAEYQDDAQGQGMGDDGGPMGGGPMGGGLGGDMPPMSDEGGDMGGDVDMLGEPGASSEGEISGAEGEMPMGGESEPPMEGIHSNKPLLNEKKDFEKFSKRNTIVERAKIYDKALMVNEEFNNMLGSLDEFMREEKMIDE